MKAEDKRYNDAVKKLSVMAEPMRMKIMKVIADAGKLRAKDILDEFAITQPTLSHHMNLLLDSDLVLAQKDGRCVWYSINPVAVSEIRDLIDELSVKGKPSSKSRAATVAPVKPIRKTTAVKKTKTSDKPALKNDSSVPKPKNKIEVPDIEELKKKKEKKKKKPEKKKKDKEKDKKKKK
ncbi:DNA-binding transcriptional regulator, ArsR family [Ruminococcaceae bacterium KH2T8]|nr:DNA-binding transcriptional regulator, ArsR family [Ruminococcaceae bacterium KH2T8]